MTDAADLALEQLRDRGSPSHDGLAARLRDFEVVDGRPAAGVQPVRWALRLLSGDAMQSLSALCVVRDADGRWLAGRRAEWLATWARRWALGAGGSVEVDENPADTLVRELEEEWSVSPERLHGRGAGRLQRDHDAGRAGVAARRARRSRRTPSTTSSPGGRPRSTAGPSEADAPLRLTAELLRDAA